MYRGLFEHPRAASSSNQDPSVAVFPSGPPLSPLFTLHESSSVAPNLKLNCRLIDNLDTPIFELENHSCNNADRLSTGAASRVFWTVEQT